MEVKTSPINLCMIAHTFHNVQLQQQTKQLLQLKKATAHALFLDKIQEHFIDINTNMIKCGCRHCFGGPNRSNNHNHNLNQYPDTGPSEWYAHCEFLAKLAKFKIVKPCLLYEWFKEMCVKFKVPIPDDNVDHPDRFPNSYNLYACLGNAYYPHDEKTQSWLTRMNNMTYPERKLIDRDPMVSWQAAGNDAAASGSLEMLELIPDVDHTIVL